jgi:polyisoprenyl-teichoic acid--peptidoglycan teichoic acid transferase
LRKKKALERFIVALIFIIIIGSSGLLITRLKTDKISNAVENSQNINMIIMVHDQGELIFSELFMYDSDTGKGSLFNIPAYMGSIIDELKKMDRIDVLYDSNNPKKYVDKISSIINIDLPYFISISKENFADIIDLFEGIKIFIANPVELLSEENSILLPSGNVVLDGSKSIAYLEYQDELDSDIEHISRRQKILQSLFSQFDNNSILLKNKNFTNYLISYLDSNLKKEALISFFWIFDILDSERIVFQRVLGNTRLVGEKNLLFPHYEGKLLRETVQQTISSLANTEVMSADELNITMEILNATEQSGLAGRTSQVFKSFGYDIVRIANFDKDEEFEKTIVISRNGDRISAEKVAEIIHCKEISYFPDQYFDNDLKTGDSEIIIILGKDFDGRYCKE